MATEIGIGSSRPAVGCTAPHRRSSATTVRRFPAVRSRQVPEAADSATSRALCLLAEAAPCGKVPRRVYLATLTRNRPASVAPAPRPGVANWAECIGLGGRCLQHDEAYRPSWRPGGGCTPRACGRAGLRDRLVSWPARLTHIAAESSSDGPATPRTLVGSPLRVWSTTDGRRVCSER